MTLIVANICDPFTFFLEVIASVYTGSCMSGSTKTIPCTAFVEEEWISSDMDEDEGITVDEEM